MKLRPIEPEDLELLYTIENDTELWETTNSDAPYSRYALKQYISSLSSFHSSGELRLIVEISDVNEQPISIGTIDLTNYSVHSSRAEVGIALLKAYRGKGYGQQALTLLEKLAVNHFRLHSLYAFVSLNNHASCSLFKKCGFQQVAVLKDWLYELGSYYPAALFLKNF